MNLSLTRRALYALLLMLPAFVQAAEDKKPHVVFLIGEEEYGTGTTLPAFAKSHLEPAGYRCSIIHAKSDDRGSIDCHLFPGLAEAMADADLLVVSTRRRFPPRAELDLIRKWVADGKPVLGVRTASHAFGPRPKGAGYQAPEGHADWPEFDRDVLGASYIGHFQNKVGEDGVGTKLRPEAAAKGNPIFQGIALAEVTSAKTTLYQSRELVPDTQVLVTGIVPATGEEEPVVWTRQRGQQRIFYTSLGGEGDMALPWMPKMLTNAVAWCLGR